MDVLLDIAAVLLSLLGIAGCMAPVLPGPPLNYLALVLFYFWGEEGCVSGTYMAVWLAVTVIVTVLDYIVPAYLTRLTGGTSAGAKGAMAGMFIGIFLIPPLGMILGSFLGALLSEMFFEGKSFSASMKPAFGSFLGFILGTGIKLVASVMMTVKVLSLMIG